ncbi:sugar O-acyltransferase (sialic acid O-acetyltransferase NeuD family) [Azospirillum fermentarium]|uniref:biotin/lipoyl-containing protein n=1 Tax=Azospirillum fermentarium TaxID=1233114 RepID=UPI002227BF56|nr:biotin/lipoyl-containing protein [Azospirillum fermentarium]MCW2249518.1 sugar O-acyltransferase (sialic acid O-acetyltransferase NeuD family) [Azospirillum fermentarium]
MHMHIQTVPQLGVNDDTVRITRWLVAEGERVAPGIAIAEVETTKAAVEITADVGGLVVFLAAEGDSLAVSKPLVLLGDDLSVLEQERDSRLAACPDSAAVAAGGAGEMVTRKAARLAAEHGLDPAVVAAETRGIVREADVRRFLAARTIAERALPERFPALNGRKPVLIWGIGNGAVTMREALSLGDAYDVVGFIADRPSDSAVKDELPVYPDTVLPQLAASGVSGVGLAITSSEQRLENCRRLLTLGIEPLMVQHPRAWVAPSARIGKGCHIKAGAVVETRVEIGMACQIDNGVIVAHDTCIGDGCHVAPGASLGSSVTVGAGTIIGIGASVATDVRIGDHSIVVVGSSVTRDVPQRSIIEGVPGRTIGRRR